MQTRFQQFVSSVSHKMEENANMHKSQNKVHAAQLEGLVESSGMNLDSFTQSLRHQQGLVSQLNQEHVAIESQSSLVLFFALLMPSLFSLFINRQIKLT